MTTKIEWAQETWNPVTGCTPVSPGCRNCYARRMAQRLRGRFGYPEDDPFRVTFHPERLDEPLRWKKPRRVFICSMGDLFHADVPDTFIHQVMARIGLAGDHDFLVLTKRAGRMADYFAGGGPVSTWGDIAKEILGEPVRAKFPQNLWLGVTAENQAAADDRIPHLLRCSAAVRFLSVEPMLSEVSLLDALGVLAALGVAADGTDWGPTYIRNRPARIDWLVIGCETGRVRRPCKLEWVRDLVSQADAAGVPVFVKRLSIDGKPTADMARWPEDLRRREYPQRMMSDE